MSRELTTKERTSLERVMVRYLKAEDEIAELEKTKNELGELIKNALIDAEISSYPLEIDEDHEKPFKCTFTIANRSFVNYNEAEIKKILGKKKFAEIVDRTINLDYDKYIAIAKEYKIPSKVAMSCITVFDKINTRKLEQAYSAGRIQLEELKGKYTVDRRPYLTHKRSK